MKRRVRDVGTVSMTKWGGVRLEEIGVDLIMTPKEAEQLARALRKTAKDVLKRDGFQAHHRKETREL